MELFAVYFTNLENDYRYSWLYFVFVFELESLDALVKPEDVMLPYESILLPVWVEAKDCFLFKVLFDTKSFSVFSVYDFLFNIVFK